MLDCCNTRLISNIKSIGDFDDVWATLNAPLIISIEFITPFTFLVVNGRDGEVRAVNGTDGRLFCIVASLTTSALRAD